MNELGSHFQMSCQSSATVKKAVFLTPLPVKVCVVVHWRFADCMPPVVVEDNWKPSMPFIIKARAPMRRTIIMIVIIHVPVRLCLGAGGGGCGGCWYGGGGWYDGWYWVYCSDRGGLFCGLYFVFSPLFKHRKIIFLSCV